MGLCGGRLSCSSGGDQLGREDGEDPEKDLPEEVLRARKVVKLTDTSYGVVYHTVPHSMVDSEADVKKVYEYSMHRSVLGSGMAGAVVKAKNRENGNLYALKTIDKRLCGDLEKLREEVSIIKQLDHPNIAKMFESFEDAVTIYLVMELCTGGELYDRLAKRKHFREHDAARLVSKMFTAVRYCHDHGVAHRDLKLQNWLFENESEGAELKLIDFGLSKRYYRSPYGGAPMPDRSKKDLSLGVPSEDGSSSTGVPDAGKQNDHRSAHPRRDGQGSGSSSSSSSGGGSGGKKDVDGPTIWSPGGGGGERRLSAGRRGSSGEQKKRKLSISSPARQEIESVLGVTGRTDDHEDAAAAASRAFEEERRRERRRESAGTRGRSGKKEKKARKGKTEKLSTPSSSPSSSGMSRTPHSGEGHQIKRLYSKVGTSYYVAPEVISRTAERAVMGYDETVDVWSMGVITYMLLSGRAPFMGDNDQQILRAVRRGKWYFAPHRIWSRISEDAKDFIRMTLDPDPYSRPTAAIALRHRWLKAAHKREAKELKKKMKSLQQREGHSGMISTTDSSVSLGAMSDRDAAGRVGRYDSQTELFEGTNLFDALRSFSKASRVKQMGLMVLAANMSHEEIFGLRQAFQTIDIQKTGYITLNELHKALKKRFKHNAGKQLDVAVVELFEELDTNGSGVIEYSDFLAATLHHNMLLDEQRLRLAFNRIDVTNTGFINKQDLAHVLGAELSDDDSTSQPSIGDKFIEKVISQVDVKGDGRISFEEFLMAMRDETGKNVQLLADDRDKFDDDRDRKSGEERREKGNEEESDQGGDSSREQQEDKAAALSSSGVKEEEEEEEEDQKILGNRDDEESLIGKDTSGNKTSAKKDAPEEEDSKGGGEPRKTKKKDDNGDIQPSDVEIKDTA